MRVTKPVERSAAPVSPFPTLLETREPRPERWDGVEGRRSTRDAAKPASWNSGASRPSLLVLGLLLVGVFLLRVWYGLSLELRTGDDVQVYLLGLKFFATGQWPFFGPDVYHTQTQIPGALQGLLVGVPLVLTRQPEAPLILLNLLSLAGLLFFGLYLSRRFPLTPAWLTCAWLLTSPWTLKYSTHVYNPSYLLLPSCLFFVAFLELVPSFTGNLLSPRAAFFLLGSSLGAALQIHLSWPLLLPFLLVAILARARARLLTPSQIGWLLLGAAVPLALLVPTVAVYGFPSLSEALDRNTRLHGVTVSTIIHIIARFLSFASFEMPHVLGRSGQAQAALLWHSPWLIPLLIALGILGLVQPFLLLAVILRPRLLKLRGDPCRVVRRLVLATVLLIWIAFFFTSRPPIARNYYILCPVAFLAAYLAFGSLIHTPRARRWVVGILACNIVFHIGFAATRLEIDPWARRRAIVSRAIQLNDYRILGERRSRTRY
jgi:hypothetical protein